MAAGELLSARLHNVGHHEVLADLEQLAREQPLGANDLVIARTGAEHVCNWFYRVKAGVITSLYVRDFATYDRVYVLNPLPGMDDAGLDGKIVETAADRYFFMRRNIPRPAASRLVFASSTLEFFEITEPPAEWAFAADGRWIGYSRTTASDFDHRLRQEM
jgi:hypothetical protein